VIFDANTVGERERPESESQSPQRRPCLFLGRSVRNVESWNVVAPQPRRRVVARHYPDAAVAAEDRSRRDTFERLEPPLPVEPAQVDVRDVRVERSGNFESLHYLDGLADLVPKDAHALGRHLYRARHRASLGCYSNWNVAVEEKVGPLADK